jgi:hypothetical protein
VNPDLRTLLERKADEMRLDASIPDRVVRRARRRRVSTALVAGAVAAGLVAGVVVSARLLLEETRMAPRVRPANPTARFYPFIYPATREELETTQDQVSRGSVPMWTEAEGVAHLFAVNVLGWDPEDVAVEVAGDTVVVRNPALPQAARFEGGLGTTLHLVRVPGSDPPIYAVVAAVAEVIEAEPVGPDAELGADGTLSFRGRVAFVPEEAMVALSVEDAQAGRAEALSAVRPDGTFLVQVEAPAELGPDTRVSIALLDGARRTLALTSSRISTPVAGGGQSRTSEATQALPAPVAETREAILAAVAAPTGDWDALRDLIPGDGFTYSFGGQTDPVAYWQRLEEEGTDVRGILRALFSVTAVRDRGMWVWPAPAGKQSSEWTEEDEAILGELVAEGVLTPQERRDFLRSGFYYGWRAGIERDGTWRFFVAGD